MLVHCVVRVEESDGTEATYHVPIGLDHARPDWIDPVDVIGEVPVPDGWAVAYDALTDPRLTRHLFGTIVPDLRMSFHRDPTVSDHSNTSIVFDDKWVLKVFRRLHEGPNPDVEMTVAMGRAGVECVPVPVAVWRRASWDLGVVRRFVPNALDGLEVAARSLHESLVSGRRPDTIRDFRADAEALGRTVARIHLASAEAFGVEAVQPGALVESLFADLEVFGTEELALGRIRAAYERLGSGVDLGQAIRVHGDLHLGQVLLTRRGWVVIDFEGEPDRDVASRRQMSSPLRDVAGVIRSFQYAAQIQLAAVLDSAAAESLATAGQEVSEGGPRPLDPPERQWAVLAEAWEDRATDGFLNGYAGVDGIDALLPPDRTSRDALLSVFELDKAVYELAYELGHRPELAEIPRSAVERLTSGETPERW